MTFSTWKQKIISKRHTASHTQVTHGMSFISSGTGIRTPTYRVRVCCATVTQYRYLEYCLSAIRFVLGCSPDVIYYNSSPSFCQYLFIIFLRFFSSFFSAWFKRKNDTEKLSDAVSVWLFCFTFWAYRVQDRAYLQGYECSRRCCCELLLRSFRLRECRILS